MCLATSGRMYAIANLSIPSSRVNTDFPFRNVAAAKAPLPNGTAAATGSLFGKVKCNHVASRQTSEIS